eukprot:5867401-Prymnesium_polylepis.1
MEPMQAATYMLERATRRPRAQLAQRLLVDRPSEVGTKRRERRLALPSALGIEPFVAAVGSAQA